MAARTACAPLNEGIGDTFVQSLRCDAAAINEVDRNVPVRGGGRPTLCTGEDAIGYRVALASIGLGRVPGGASGER